MISTSKDLLDLECSNTATSSSLESKLIVCKQNPLFNSKNQLPKPDKKPEFSSLPKSQVLGKVKDFLGVMAEANEKLQLDVKDNTEKYDIEVLSGNDSEYIEMDLMLGVADLQTPEAIAAAESAIAGHQPIISLAGSSSESESDDSSDGSGSSSSASSDSSESSDEDDDSDDEADVKAARSSCTEGKRRKPAENDPSSDTLKNQSSKKRPKIIELP